MSIRSVLSLVFLMTIICNAVKAETQLQMNTAACNEMKNADTRLNQVYKKVLEKYADDKMFINKFVIAQQKWIAFRDAYVDSMYIPENKDSYGSVFSMCQCTFLENIINDRIKQLQVWLNGIEEGDVCSGSVSQ
ncbi:lysozyme inhibitor LprI family protein [uncultured Legionella sp.]|uniref:lysozyme inhibitor LprI family protein n=1 Tax=uncultured Legionella sp. TaxID=210934 RepID=UPI002621408F|nr:lysozyme inhibitor LprI family protein [uncultured Legionella sp.]